MKFIIPLILVFGCTGRPVKTNYNPDLYVIEGQSNAAGCGPVGADLPEDLKAPLAGIETFVVTRKAWETLQLGVNSRGTSGFNGSDNIDPLEGLYGVEGRLMKLISTQTSRRQYLFKWAMSQTSLANFGNRKDWYVGNTDECFGLSCHAYTTAIGLLKDKRPPRAYIWIQAEGDAGNLKMARAYKKNLEDYIEEKRDFYKYPQMPFLIVQLSDNQTAIKKLNRDIIKAAQISIGKQANNYTVQTDDLATIDGIHYNGRSIDTLAVRIFHVLQSIVMTE